MKLETLAQSKMETFVNKIKIEFFVDMEVVDRNDHGTFKMKFSAQKGVPNLLFGLKTQF